MTAEIRPGIRRPDWSAVTRPAAREALLARDDNGYGCFVKNRYLTRAATASTSTMISKSPIRLMPHIIPPAHHLIHHGGSPSLGCSLDRRG